MKKIKPIDLDENIFFTDIYDEITVNGRISKKLFQKVVEPLLHRGLKALERNDVLINVIKQKSEEIDSLKKQLDEALVHLGKTISESIGGFDTANAYEFLQKMKVKND